MAEEQSVKSNKKAAIIAVSCIVFLSILIALAAISQHIASENAANQAASKESPKYQTILPNGKSIQTLGGWERVSPEGAEPVYAFADSIEGIPISVSQQQLPEDFRNDVTNKVAELAEKFSATNTLDVDGTKVYLGTSAKGPQSVIFARDELLILIKSQQKIKDAAWKGYIQSLTIPLNATF